METQQVAQPQPAAARPELPQLDLQAAQKSKKPLGKRLRKSLKVRGRARALLHPSRRPRAAWASKRGPGARAAAAGLRAAALPGFLSSGSSHCLPPSPPARPRPWPSSAEAGHAALAPGLAARRLCLARCEQHHGGRGGGAQRACLPRCL